MFSPSPIFIALQREASIGAEMIASGVTLLGKANSFRPGLYSQAFFNLTIGLERTAKLVVLLDYYFDNDHTFFDDNSLRNKYGHDLNKLLETSKRISKKLVTDERYKFPDTELHKKLILFLSDFAKTTRYYNLDLLTNTGKNQRDPIKVWNADIGSLILKKYPLRKKSQAPEALIKAMGPRTRVMGTAEEHSLLKSLVGAAQKSYKSELINKFGRLLILQIVRAMTETISELTMKAYKEQTSEIPILTDFFRIFHNEDSYFLKRKTWIVI